MPRKRRINLKDVYEVLVAYRAWLIARQEGDFTLAWALARIGRDKEE